MTTSAVSEQDVKAAWELPFPGTPYDLWTRTNVGEVFPNAVTPLTWAVYQGIAEATFLNNPERVWLIPQDLFQDGQPPLMFRAINGRLFFNTGLVYEIATERLGMPSWFYNLALGGPQEGERLHLPPRGIHPTKLARALPMLLKEQRRLEDVVAEFERAAPAMRAEVQRLQAEDLSALDITTLLARLDAVSASARAPYTQLFDGSQAALNTYGVLAWLAERWTGDRALANDLVTGLANLLTAQASIALWEVARAAQSSPAALTIIREAPAGGVRARLRAEPSATAVADALDRFFAAHGHRSADEFELAVPRWSEDPSFVIATLRTYLDAPAEMDPSRHLARQQQRRRAAERRAQRRLSRGTVSDVVPWRWLIFKSTLKRAQRFLPMRENPKYHFLLYAAEMRRTALALGDRLAGAGSIKTRDDVFFLARPDLDRAAADEAGDLRALVEARRTLYARYAAWSPPEVVEGRDVTAAETAVLNGAPAARPSPPVLATSRATGLKGIAASAGRVTGRVRVALTPEEGADLEPGEVLVAPFTDPGWTPLFTVAAAIVMDLGGLLSHGAIVAREYGIPAVVNTRSATTTLRTGQLVTVDGNSGEVSWEPDV